jgi:uncharacterized cupredoxin-like copper-binding protein
MMRRLATVLTLALASTAGAQQAAPHGAHGAPQGAKGTQQVASAKAAPVRLGARTVTITARDYAYEVQDTIESGYVNLRLVNQGPELHHVQLIRLAPGKSLQDLFQAMQAGGPPPAWAVDVGGPNTPVPGGESFASLELKPGRYALVCFIPSPDGKPHIMKGMAKEITVKPAKAPRATPKAPATTVTLSDYDFSFSKPLVAGRQTIRVVNAAEQPHEIVIAKLVPGKTAMELAQWAEKPAGPPPGAPVGGTTAMTKGGWNDVTIDFEAGTYALICFIPDAKDGKPHLVHGMIKEITVAPRVAGK